MTESKAAVDESTAWPSRTTPHSSAVHPESTPQSFLAPVNRTALKPSTKPDWRTTNGANAVTNGYELSRKPD